MADLPTPQSYEQILSDMLSSYAAKVGIDDFNVGSAVTSFFEVVALSTARASGDIFQILNDFSVDRATGDALQRLALENNVTPLGAQIANGYITVTDTSFTKVSTAIYAGTNPPNVGSTTVNISSNAGFTPTGAVYIGRGTPDVEGPLSYSSITPSGSFYILNLTTPTTKYHNIGETVILSQGGVRSIPINTIVISPGIGSTPDIQYQTTVLATILDGETEVDNVPISALSPGSASNVPSASISSFAATPFSGAAVTNPLPLTSGSDGDTDSTLRTRIKLAQSSTGLGTVTAIENAIIGATAPDQNDTIQSASVQTQTDGSATVYIDDGNGYEATVAGVGIESIVDSAIGGEQFFQLATGGTQAPVAKAFLESSIAAPFDLIGGDTLAITVGETTYQHVFQNSDFRSPGGATAFEVTASVNADTALGFEAVTSGGGTFVVFRAKAESPDSLQTATPTTDGRNASVLLGLPSAQVQTLRLYKNNLPLTKDGNTAEVFSQSQSLWSNTIANGDTLILSVDGTASITYTILNSDFIATGLYTSVSSTNSLDSWAQVFNAKLTGVTVAVLGTQLTISSNLGTSNRAQVVIDPSSTLVTKGMFTSNIGLSSQGKASDFTLDRNTAQFQLVTPLTVGDQLSAGSADTQAMVSSASISSGTITFPGDAHVWLLLDTPGQLVPTGVAANTLISVSKPASNTVRYTSLVASAFANVLVGDYVIIWSQELSAANRLEGRVHAVTGTTLDLLVTASEYSAAVVETDITYQAGFVVMRSNLAPQKFKVAAGAYSLDNIAIALQAQTNSLTFSVSEEQFLIVRSVTLNQTGSIFVVTADANGILLQLPVGTTSVSQTSLIAFYDSQEFEADMPLFIHSTASTDASANPIDSYISTFDSTVDLSARDPNELIAFLQPYGTIRDAQPYGEWVQETALPSANVIDVTRDPDLRRIRSAVDRFYVANPLDFGFQDTSTVVLDEDPVNETFTIPFYRKALTNTGVASNSFTFNAYDVDSGATANFVSAFGNFDFSNFKVLMQAKKTLKQFTGSPTQTALLYRAAAWGRTGTYINVAYVYPSVPNSPISSTVSVTDDIVININLKSGALSTNTIDGTTQWNVTITANTPVVGIDQVKYTWNGTGTAPSLSLSGGEYVNITSQTAFSLANTGIFRVSTQGGPYAPTATSFTVQRPTGAAVAESNKATVLPGGITFYLPSSTTAAAINTYVNANLSQYVTSTIVNDGGMSGSGVISLSTYEDSGFVSQSVQLLDGINWLANSNLSGSPQFTLKLPLALPTDVGYAFNNGETIRFVPTTVDQVRRLISVLAVTGFTVYGSAAVSNRGNQLELSTDILGSSGAIQVIGGSANQYQVPVLDSAIRLDATYAQISANNVASAPVASDQWFRLQASEAQAKETLFGDNTSVTVLGNNPTTGESTIQLLNRTLTQRYFGRPRHNVRVWTPTQTATFRIEKQGDLVCLSTNPSSTLNPNFVKSPLNFNDSGGGTANVTPVLGTSEVQYIITSGNANFTELSIGDLLTVSGSGFSAANEGSFLVTGVSDDGTIAQVLNQAAVSQTGVTFVAGQFSATSGVMEGDTIILGPPFNVLNQGKYRVIREYNNSVWFENSNVIEEEVTLPSNLINLGFDATTSFMLNASNHTAFLTWNGTGTEPFLGNALMGDVVTFGADFNVANRGSFMVRDSGAKLQEIATFTMPPGSQFPASGAGAYFDLNNAGNTALYRIWFNVFGGSNVAPASGGRTLVMVTINASDISSVVATDTANAINPLNSSTDFVATASGNVVTVTTQGYNTTTAPVNGTMPSPFSISVLQSGRRTFLECINPSAVNNSPVLVSTSILDCNRPQMKFWEYEATVPGDKFVASGSSLTTPNAGSYVILQVLDQDTAIVTGSMANVTNVSLDGITTSVFVQEGVPYTGYKRVKLVAAQPGTTDRNYITFDTNAQSDKINQAAGVSLTSLSKMNFSTILRSGLDSYFYNTGLIAEANRIIYGDPRDPVTYPGVGAAGADIFVREPLTLRVQVGVDIRLNTGVPFVQTATQVRSSVSGLINSNPVGQSIAIGDIIAAVQAIPGIKSVAISSPLYDVAHDLITVVPSQKTRIIDPTIDISVSQIGT